MTRPGRWISLLPILALVPRLGLVGLAADRQTVAPETRTALLWISSAALAALVGLSEVYAFEDLPEGIRRIELEATTWHPKQPAPV